MKRNCLLALPLLLVLFVSCASFSEKRSTDRPDMSIRGISTAPADDQSAKKDVATVTGWLTGPMAGGTLGLYAFDMRRTQSETNEQYGYAHDRGTAARIESAQVLPRFAKPGEQVDLKVTYVVLSHSSELTVVRETREILYGENLLGNPEVEVERAGGTYESVIAVSLPEDLKPGTYKVRYIVQTPTSRDVRETNFTVQE